MVIDKNKFDEGLELILGKWTALNLACENNWGGNSAKLKREILKNTLYTIINKGTNTTTTLATYLWKIMDSSFLVTLEDDSHFEVANLIIELYEDLSNNRNDFFEKIKKIESADVQLSKGVDTTTVTNVDKDVASANTNVSSQSDLSSEWTSELSSQQDSEEQDSEEQDSEEQDSEEQDSEEQDSEEQYLEEQDLEEQD